MRQETQKQIVKAFAMMYEDTDMPLAELIEKLQELNGSGGTLPKPKQSRQETKRHKNAPGESQRQILDLLKEHGSMRSAQISRFIDRSRKTTLNHLHALIDQNKINENKINARLSEYSLA